MRSRTVDLDGPVFLADFGGGGAPILLVHGIDGSHANFGAAGPLFARLGRTYAVDLIGFGYTPPAGRTADLRSNRRLLVRLLREVLVEPTVVLGTSMGGLLGMLVAGAAPDLVRALVLVGPGQPRPRGVPVNASLAAAFIGMSLPLVGPRVARRRYRGAPEERAARSLAFVCAHPETVPTDARAAYVDMARQRAAMPWTPEAFRQAASSMFRELRVARGFPAFVRRLEPPTLLVQGARDRLVNPQATRQLAALRPDWEHVVLDDVGHSPQLEAPEKLFTVVASWLRTV